MAGRIAQITTDRNWPEVNPNFSSDLNAFGFAAFNPAPFDAETRKGQGGRSAYRMTPANLWAIGAQHAPSFFDDFYNRIHISPAKIDLATVASSQTREFSIWNAYVKSASNIQEILVSQPLGVVVTGQGVPYAMPPLKELIYEVTVGVSGPPTINIEIQFDFSNAVDQPAILITGTRAFKFDIVPEVPIIETWEWLSDNIVTVDGTEQRIALRGEVPRVEVQSKVIFDTVESIRRFYANLATAVGRLWIPEFQYATPTTSASALGTFAIYFDVSKTDIREGEYILIQTPSSSALVEIGTIEAFGALVNSALAIEIPAKSLIIPGSPALVDNNTAISRYAVNDVAELQLTSKLIRQRSQLAKPGITVTFEQYGGIPILTKRPLANELVRDEVSTGQISLDNRTGVQDIVSRWDYSRIGGPRSFKVNRISNPEELDYWKAFFAYCRGQARRFWMPTYRTDLAVIAEPADAATNYTVKDKDYAEKIWTLPTHRFIEIETAGGIHRTEIIGASANEDGTSTILFSPAVPVGVEWKQVKRISYLLPVRLSDDKIEWKHYGLESLLSFSIRTAEV